jgi:uncharacterized protein involved in outer membrane biogenesis
VLVERKAVKKLIIALGILFSLWVAAAFIIPQVIDVDKYRPQIVEMANQQIHGKLELGKLSLSLWGQIRVQVGGLKLLDATGKEVVAVKNAYFHLPFIPLISGSPVLTFKMSEPSVHVIKDSAGQLNVMSLVKPTSPQANATSTPHPVPVSAQDAPKPTGSQSIPAIATRARLGVELLSALLSYQDDTTGLKTEVKDLNLIMKDISLSHPTEIEMWADLNTQLGKTFMLRGPARFTGKAQPQIQDGKIHSVSLISRLDMDSVEMAVPGAFEKKKGMATHVELAVSVSEAEAKIEKFIARFFNAEVTAEGTITQLTAAPGTGGPVVNMTVKSNSIEFKPWVELVPMLKEYELGGNARFEAQANGPSEKLGYHAKLSFNGITAKSPQLKAQPQIDGLVSVVTDQIENMQLTLKAPGNDLKVQGKMVSFTRPRLDLVVTSSGMDLDQWIVFPDPAPKEKEAAAPISNNQDAQTTAKKAPAADYDALLAPLRQNKMLADMIAHLSVDMKFLKAKNVKISDISCKMSFKDLAAGMDACGLKVFGGAIKTTAQIQMKPETPAYQFNTQVDGLNISEAVESQMALFKNTVTGKTDFSMKAQGLSFNPDAAIRNLKAQGKMKVAQANFATIDVMKMVGESVTKAMDQIGNKVPAVKGKSIGQPSSKGTEYEVISSDFTIAGGKFSAPNFQAKAVPDKGIDLKGNTVVGMKDYSLSADWEVIDTYNLTRLRDVSIEQGGTKVEHLLAEGNQPVRFPIHVGCTIMAPCYNSTQVAEALGAVALKNIATATTGRAKEEVRKQAESLIKKVAPPEIQDKIQDKLKGLFR